MINFDIFAAARQKRSPAQMPFLLAQLEDYRIRKPFQGLKILHNIPLTIETIIKIEPLLAAGADVTVTWPAIIKPDPDALDLLSKANVKLMTPDDASAYDVHLDCAAGLIHLPAPKLGSVELTGSGTIHYKATPLPYTTISVDDCHVKHLESIGTGHGFIKAFQQLTGESLQNQPIVIFGYGKIGRGIVRALLPITNNITLVDNNRQLVNRLQNGPLTILHLDQKKEIKHALDKAFCVVTVTGRQNCISEHFERSDFNNAYLANMGAEDEFGPKFSTQEVLFDKCPINFALEEPTTVHYLDPILYIHNHAIELLLEGNLANQYNPYPEDLSLDVLNRWAKIHNQDLNSTLC